MTIVLSKPMQEGLLTIKMNVKKYLFIGEISGIEMSIDINGMFLQFG